MNPLLDCFVVVLVEPQLAVNVGTVLRAMKNMGLQQLRLVRPAEMEIERTQIAAHRTLDLLERIERFDSLDLALADCQHAVAFTARDRSRPWDSSSPREAAPRLLAEAAAGARIALVFGREQDGLANDEVEACDAIVTIPTRPDYSSLNLAQAVLVMAYELLLASAQPATTRSIEQRPLASLATRRRLLAQIHYTLEAIGFFKSRAVDGVVHRLTRIFTRARLDDEDAHLLLGVFVEVLKFALLVRRGIVPTALQAPQPKQLDEAVLGLIDAAMANERGDGP